METVMMTDSVEMNPLKAAVIGTKGISGKELNPAYVDPMVNLGTTAILAGAGEPLARGLLSPLVTGDTSGVGGAALTQMVKEINNLGFIGEAMRKVAPAWEPTSRSMHAIYCNAQDFLNTLVTRYGLSPVIASEQVAQATSVGGLFSGVTGAFAKAAEVSMLKNITDANATNEGGAKWSNTFRVLEVAKNISLPIVAFLAAGPYGLMAGAALAGVSLKVGLTGAKLADQVAKGYDAEDKESVAKLAKTASDKWLKTPGWRARFRSISGAVQATLGLGFGAVAFVTGAPVLSLIGAGAGLFGLLEAKGQDQAAKVYDKMVSAVRGEHRKVVTSAKNAAKEQKATAKADDKDCKDSKKDETPVKAAVAQPV